MFCSCDMSRPRKIYQIYLTDRSTRSARLASNNRRISSGRFLYKIAHDQYPELWPSGMHVNLRKPLNDMNIFSTSEIQLRAHLTHKDAQCNYNPAAWFRRAANHGISMHVGIIQVLKISYKRPQVWLYGQLRGYPSVWVQTMCKDVAKRSLSVTSAW